MVSVFLEDTMSIDTIFATAIEGMAKEQAKDLKDIVHGVMALSSPDVSIREFRRICRPDKNGRFRNLTLREAYEFSRVFGKNIDDVIAYGITKS